MKIEEINSKELSKSPNQELHILHLRFIQLWNKNFDGNRKIRVGSLERDNFLGKYKLLIKEMDNRKLTYSTQNIDRAIFRKSMYGLNASALGDMVITPDYIAIGGSFVKSPKEAKDLDLIIRDDEKNRDAGMELKLSRSMQKQIKKDCHFVYNKTGAHSTYLPLFDLTLRAKNEIKRVEVKEDYNKAEELEKGCRPAFGSPGGKRYLAKTIVSYIPEHKTYVENFMGGGAAFFAKEPSEVEVINDLDKDIAFAYRFIKNMTDEQFKALKSKNWKDSKTLFDKLKNLKTDEPLEKIRRILYLRKLSYGKSSKNYDQTNEGRDLAGGLDNLLTLKKRLKDVKIENNDYKKSINYDSKETFYYLDPPYPETNNVGNIKLIELHNFCRNLKGRFILSLNDIPENRKIFKDFNIKKVEVSQQMFTGGSQMQMRTELLISNFPLKEENIYLAKSDEDYYEGLDEWKQDFIYDFAEMAKNLEGKTILDLGCGTGRVMQALINSDYYNYQVDGVDNNDVALAMCKKRGLAGSVKKLDLEKDKLPYADNFFCNVIGLHILEHLKEPGKVIKEAIRVSNNKVIFISPLGKRLDLTHKQEFIKIDDFKTLFDKNAEIKMVEHGDNTAIAIIKVAKIKKADNLKPFGTFIPPKPTMAKITEAFEYSQIENWAKDRFPLDVEEKLNAFRCVAEKLGDKLRLKTEGNKDRTKQLLGLVKVLEKVPDDFILDFGLGIDRDGRALPRIKLMTLMSDEPVLEEKDIIKATIFDLPYWKEDLHNKPLKERRERLEKFYGKYLKGDPHFALTNFIIVKNGKELEAQFKKLSKLPQSEGIMVKDLNSIWDTDGSITGWAKIKIEAEIKVIAIKKIPNKAGGYNYHCGLLPGDSKFTNLIEFKGKKYIDLGKTFNTKINANVGDILTVGIEEIIPSDDKLQWLGPRVIDIDKDRKEPYFANQVIGIAERANVLQKSKHKRTECMMCSKPPDYEILWAEGMAHAWFCKKHFKEWLGPNSEKHSGGFDDVDYVKEVKDGMASKKFGDNPNPNIIDQLKAEFTKDWVNSPNFAYQTVYGKLPDPPLMGRTDSPKRMWNDKEVDKEFKDTWLKDLNNIPDIEIRATDIGHSSDRVAFVVFRFKDKSNDSKARNISDSLNKLEGVYCKSDIGSEGRPRICVAGKIKLEDKGWEAWWNGLADKIKSVIEAEIKKAEEGNIDYKVGDTGKGVLQLHIMGIEEDKIADLKRVAKEAVSSRTNPTKLKMLLKAAIGEQGAHIDLRMVRKSDDFFEGGEIMIGNLTGLDKLKKLDEGGKLRFGWKVPRKEEPEAETVRGPVSWMNVGRGKVDIFAPGTVGATTNKYGAMLILDDFDFKAIEPQDNHAKKFEFKGIKIIPVGTYLMAYVPVTEAGKKGERVWMISKLKEEAKKFKKYMPIFDISKNEDEHIVAGVVYSPDEIDSQGDTTTEEEIRKAAYRFIEEVQKFKVNHEGKFIKVKILEFYLAPQNLVIAGQNIKKGSWIMILRIMDEVVWKKIKSGELTGFSLAGKAHGVLA